MNTDVTIEFAEALGGWTVGGSSEIEYRHNQLPQHLDAISKIAYPNLDLSHLYTQQDEK